MSASYTNTELYDNEIIRRYQQMVPVLKDKLEKTLRLYSNMVRQHAECHEGDVFRLDTSEYTRHLADVVRHLDEMQLLLSAISAWGSLPIECMTNPSGRGAGGPPGMDGNVVDFNVLEAEGRSQLERMMAVQSILQKCRAVPPQPPPHMMLQPQGTTDGDESQLQSMISSEEDRDEQSLLGKHENMEGLDQEDLHIMSLDTTLKELAEDGATIGFEDSVMEDTGGVGELLDDDFSMSPPAVVSSLPPPTNPASVPVTSMQTPPPPPPPRPSTASERIPQTSQPIRPASIERSPWFRPKDEPRSSRPSSNDSSAGVVKQEDSGCVETPLETLLRSRTTASPADTFSGTGSGSRPASVSTPSFTPQSQGLSHTAPQQQSHKSPSPQQYLQHQQLTPQQQPQQQQAQQQQQEESQADQFQTQELQQQQPQPPQPAPQQLQQQQQLLLQQRQQQLQQQHEHNQQQMQQQQQQQQQSQPQQQQQFQQQPLISQHQQLQRMSQFEQQQQQQGQQAQSQQLQIPQESFKMEPTSVPAPTMSSVKMEEMDEDDTFGGTS